MGTIPETPIALRNRPRIHPTSVGGSAAEHYFDLLNAEQIDNAHARRLRSSLDHQETNVDSPGLRPAWEINEQRAALETSFRHSGWSAHRLRIALAMPDAGLNPARRARFLSCGRSAWVVRHPEHRDRYAVRSAHCHDRFCVPCSREKGFRIAMNVLKHAQTKQLRFLTLTIRHSDAPLTKQLDKLIRSFRKLRQTARWKANTTGGAAWLELKLARDHTHWHPHLHVLHEGQYIEVGWLAHDWHRITGDSYIVDVRTVKGNPDVVRYVTKYASKPLGLALTHHRDKLCEALADMTARRLMTTFGSWRGFKLCEHSPAIDWQPIAPLVELIARRAAGDPWAENLLAQLSGRQPWNRKPHPMRPRPPPPPPCASLFQPPARPSAPVAATA